MARIGRVLGAALPLVGAAAGAPAQAPARVDRVIELFTSQGCPRCPAADRLVGDLAREPDTVVLSFAVDTWDFAGWKDTLALPASTRRQHAYAAGRGDGLVYTPQVVVDGLAAQPGVDRPAIERSGDLLRGEGLAMNASVALSEADGRLAITVGGRPETAGGLPVGIPVGIYVLRVARTRTVSIDRGDNSGRSVTYTNVVRAMGRIGDWTGPPARFDLVDLKGEDEGYVVLLQAGTPDRLGVILAAAKTPNL